MRKIGGGLGFIRFSDYMGAWTGYVPLFQSLGFKSSGGYYSETNKATKIKCSRHNLLISDDFPLYSMYRYYILYTTSSIKYLS